MQSLGQIIDEFSRQTKAGKSPKLFVADHLLPAVVDLLKRDGYGIAERCLKDIANDSHREVLQTLLYSTCAFAVAGATVGATVGGPSGAATGAAIGAAVGLGAGVFVVAFVSFQPDPNRGGYVLSAA